MHEIKTGGGRRIERRSQGCHKEDTYPLPNITMEERKAITQLKKDTTRMILRTDKGVSLVIMNTEDYIKKAEDLLTQPTYKFIPTDPTTLQPDTRTNS